MQQKWREREMGIRIGGRFGVRVCLVILSVHSFSPPPSLSVTVTLHVTNAHTHNNIHTQVDNPGSGPSDWWLCERPQRQQHYREMDRWKGRRRDEEKNWNESSNRVRPSSSLLTYWSQTAALLERFSGCYTFYVTFSCQNVSFMTTEMIVDTDI